MTSFLDVIRPLTEQLENLANKAKAAASQYTTNASEFQSYVDSHISGVQGGVAFLGKGAEACTAAVGRNVTRAQHVITKLSDVQLACTQTKNNLEEMSAPFDKESYYHLTTDDLYGSITFRNADPHMTFIIDYFLQAQGYSPYDNTDPNTTVIWRIREDTLPGLSWQLDTLLTAGKGESLLEESINYAVSCIRSDFERYKSKRHDDLYDDLHNGGPYGKIEKDQYDYYISQADSSFTLAMHYVDAIAEKMRKGYVEWDKAFQALVGQFRADLDTASAISAPGLGDLLDYVNAGPLANAKVLVWETPDGLVVVVKDGTSAAEVEAALAKYGDRPITLIGDGKGGSRVAQDLILDQENKGEKDKLNVTNLVVVGAPLDDKLPDGINYFSYQTQPEVKEEDEGKFLGLKPDQIVIPLTAVAIGLFTDGIGELPLLAKAGMDVGVELSLAEGWNAAEEVAKKRWEEEHPGEPMPTGNDSPIYLKYPNGDIHQASDAEISLGMNGKLPDGTKVYFKTSYAVPGAKGENFSNNSYLNSQMVPDPNTGKLPHGGALPVSG